MGFAAAKAADGMYYYGPNDRHRFKIHAHGSRSIPDWFEVEWQRDWRDLHEVKQTLATGLEITYKTANPWCSVGRRFVSKDGAENFAKMILDTEVEAAATAQKMEEVGMDGQEFLRRTHARRTQEYYVK
jgi:hypothetical protein